VLRRSDSRLHSDVCASGHFANIVSRGIAPPERVQKGRQNVSGKEIKEVVVPKENAVFRLDAHGRWHNEHGVFEHKKIIDYFHSSIRKDADGYHLFQNLGNNTIEKVYFNYEDTALFVFDIDSPDDSDETRLVLNTKEKIPLDPKTVFIQNDNLYVENDGHRIKFIDRAMLKLAHRLTFDQQQYRLEFSGKTYAIPIRGGHNPTKNGDSSPLP
jgi:hypothetical protein